MHIWNISRHNDTDLVFEGDHLFTMDDREWLGVTPNWWELSLYRTAHDELVLASVYFQNFPFRRTICGALVLPDLTEVARCLRERCGAPEIIVEALLARARRSLSTPCPVHTAQQRIPRDLPPVTAPAPVNTSCQWQA